MKAVVRFREDTKMGLRKFKDAPSFLSAVVLRTIPTLGDQQVIGVLKSKTPDASDERCTRVNGPKMHTNVFSDGEPCFQVA
jgi:hypothetical protein